MSPIPHYPAAARPVIRPHVALAVLLAAGLAHPAVADVVSWNTGNGSYFTPGNWTPSGIPTSGDTVRIGNLPGVQNSTVLLGGASDAGAEVLEITDGMTVDLNGTEWATAHGEVSISGNNSRLIVRPAPGFNVYDFNATLILGAGSRFELMDNAPARIYENSQSSGTIAGRGLMEIAINFRNDGIINPSGNGGLEINALTPIDLDGTSGNGHLLLDVAFDVLGVNASALNDPFSGTITMVPGTLLTMNIDDGWTADASALININGANNPGSASQIMGDLMTLNGVLNVGASQAHLRVLAPATLDAEVTLSPAGWLELDGATTVLGGEYTLGLGAKLDFDGPATIDGGTFTTRSTSAADGAVAFSGDTTWTGTATINGVGRQTGEATVTSAAVINADVFDMDGAESGVWNINNSLVVNAQFIELPVGNINQENWYNGSIQVAGGFLACLTVNVAAPNSRWTVWGDLTLSGDPALFVTRIAGSGINIMNDLIVTGKAQISADTYLANGTNVHLAAAGSVLRINDRSQVYPGTVFQGAGTLQNGPAGQMYLYGASLSGVGLVNQGDLVIGAGPGEASVDRFVQTADGTWHVSIGGPIPGDDHDELVVTGGSAQLGGELEVTLPSSGGGTYSPSIGQQFIILRALGGVSGAFTNDPTTVNAAGTYEWTVLYTPTAVVLRLDTFVPIPPCYANCDGSSVAPILNVNDFVCFQTKFAGGSSYANCDGSTASPVLNVNDFTCFLNKYAAGCP